MTLWTEYLNRLESLDEKDLSSFLKEIYIQINSNNHSSFDKEAFYFFEYLKETFLIPSLVKGQFRFEFFQIASLILKHSIKLEENPDLNNIIKNFDKNKSENHHSGFHKMLNACHQLSCFVFNGNFNEAKTGFVTEIFSLKPEQTFNSKQDFLAFRECLIHILGPLNEAIQLISQTLFEDTFWNKNLITQKTNFNWVIQVLWDAFGTEKEFLKIYPVWKNLFNLAIQKNQRELVFFMHFPLSHVYFNLVQTQDDYKKFNDEVEKPLSDYIIKITKEDGIEPVNRKIHRDKKPLKIGFVYDRINFNSPYKILYSLLKGLTQISSDNHQFTVYDIEYLDKSESGLAYIQAIKDLGVDYVNNNDLASIKNKKDLYYNHYEKSLALRNKIVEDKIDILIICNNRETYSLLFSCRCAPVQIYWSQGNFVYDINGIDKRITHCGYGTLDKDGKFNLNNHDFFRIVIGMDKEFYSPKVDLEEIRKVRNQYPKEAVILGSIGRLNKMDNKYYIETVSEILKQNPNTIYLACGNGSTESIKKEAAKYGMENRFYFTGSVNPHVYGHVIDLFLNTFPLGHGESLTEYMSKRKLHITLADEMSAEKFLDHEPTDDEIKQQIKWEIVEENKNTAISRSDYVKLANHYIRVMIPDAVATKKYLDIALTTLDKAVFDYENAPKNFLKLIDSFIC